MSLGLHVLQQGVRGEMGQVALHIVLGLFDLGPHHRSRLPLQRYSGHTEEGQSCRLLLHGLALLLVQGLEGFYHLLSIHGVAHPELAADQVVQGHGRWCAIRDLGSRSVAVIHGSPHAASALAITIGTRRRFVRDERCRVKSPESRAGSAPRLSAYMPALTRKRGGRSWGNIPCASVRDP